MYIAKALDLDVALSVELSASSVITGSFSEDSLVILILLVLSLEVILWDLAMEKTHTLH